MAEQNFRERVVQMTDAELSMWLAVFENMADMEFCLAGLEANFSPGRRLPSQQIADALAAIKTELARRSGV